MGNVLEVADPASADEQRRQDLEWLSVQSRNIFDSSFLNERFYDTVAFPGTTPQDKHNKSKISSLVISIESAGMEAGNFASIDVNGEGISREKATRGLNVVIVSGSDGEIKMCRTFDTFNSTSDSDAFAAEVEKAEAGDYICVAVKDECMNNMNDRGKTAISSCGAVQFKNCKYRSSYALIGVKGAPAGTAQEALAHGSESLPPITQTIALQMSGAAVSLQTILRSQGVTTAMSAELETDLAGDNDISEFGNDLLKQSRLFQRIHLALLRQLGAGSGAEGETDEVKEEEDVPAAPPQAAVSSGAEPAPGLFAMITSIETSLCIIRGLRDSHPAIALSMTSALLTQVLNVYVGYLISHIISPFF